MPADLAERHQGESGAVVGVRERPPLRQQERPSMIARPDGPNLRVASAARTTYPGHVRQGPGRRLTWIERGPAGRRREPRSRPDAWRRQHGLTP